MDRIKIAKELIRIAKSLTSKTELEKVSGAGRRDLYLVKRDEEVVGFLSKQPNSRTEEYPWQAFEVNFRAGRGPVVGRLIDSFFEADGGRKAALKALGV